MRKLSILAALMLLTASAAVAQQRTGTLTGQITDNETGESVIGAVVEMKSAADTTQLRHEVSGMEGKFSITGLSYGDYTMLVTFLGYEPVERTVTINARNINISHVFLNRSLTEIGAVDVVAQAMRTSLDGDTVIYNAHAFKVSEDGDADELLRQLPGVEVGMDGTVKAQGKNVQKIFVDGKESFGTDVATTMKNVPANVIDRVEVYNKLSDFAETTGIDDGDQYQVMNLVTGVSFAQFGTFSALYGIEDKYGLDAAYNIVTGSHGFIVNASTSNTGTMGMGDGGGMMMVGGMGGGGYGGRYGAMGGMSPNNKSVAYDTRLNYNYTNGEKLRVNFNYRFGHDDRESKSESDRTYFNTSAFDDLYNRSTENGTNSSINNRHNFGGGMRWQIDGKQMLNLRMQGSLSNGNSRSWRESNQFTDVPDNLFQYYRSMGGRHSETLRFDGSVNYGVKFAKAGRSLSVGLNVDTNKDDGNSSNDIRQRIPGQSPPLDSLGRSRTENNSHGWDIRSRIQYTEPISNYWRALATYDFSYGVSDRDNNSNRWDYDGDFEQGNWVAWGEGSNILQTRDLSHRMGTGVHYSKNRNMLRLDLVYKYTGQEMERTLPEPYFKGKVDFNNFVYNAMYNLNLSPQDRMEFRLEADTRNPSITQLQDVDDISNSIYVSSGNPDLKPYYSHSGSVGYNTNNLVNATSFSINAHGSLTTDFIGTRTIIVTEDTETTPNGTVLKKGSQWSRPENMNRSSWSMGVYASFSKPLNFIESNFYLDGQFNYDESPGYINGQMNTARRRSYMFGANMNSNWSTDLIMSLSYGFSPSFTNNSHKDYRKASSVGNTFSFDMSWTTWLDFVLRADLRYTNELTRQKGVDDYRFENTACNISLGKKIFRNKRGEVTVAVYDLFDQNRFSNQSINANYIENVVERGIGRYFSIGFTYRLRDFYKNGESVSRGVGAGRPRPGGRAGRGGFGGGGRRAIRMY